MAKGTVPIRAARPEVNAVLRRLRNLGLRLEFSTSANHWRVIDPGTGAYLTSVSSTPSDINWWQHIRRAVERAGFSWYEGGRRKLKRTERSGAIAAIDLEALAHAQRMARIHGAREPQLEDLADVKFLTRIRQGFNEQEMEEAISSMPHGVESARAHRVIGRLLSMVEQRGEEMGKRARERNPKIRSSGGVTQELMHVSREVATKRGLRYWRSEESAYNSLSNLLNGTNKGMTTWVANLLEATMDDLDGLRWDIEKSEPLPIEHEPVTSPSLYTVSIGEAQQLILDSLTDEWTSRADIHDPLVPSTMPETMFQRAATNLGKDGILERQKMSGGHVLYRRSAPKPPPAPQIESELPVSLAERPEDEAGQVFSGSIADRYADVLLGILRSQAANGIQDWQHVEPILTRLDKLAGVGQE